MSKNSCLFGKNAKKIASQLQLNIDIHGEGDRELELNMPKWYSFSNINLLSDTILGSMAYTIKVIGKYDSLLSVKKDDGQITRNHDLWKESFSGVYKNIPYETTS